MKDFIQRLYELENFPVYLGIIIVILLIIFIIVYFLGKKDSNKLEATQKIDKVVDDAFKETSVTEQVEVPVVGPTNMINPFLVNNASVEPQIEPVTENTYPSIPLKAPEIVVEENELRAPQIEVPEIKAPIIEEPELRAPQIEIPEIKAPIIEDAELRAPQIEVPEINTPIIEEPELRAEEITIEAPLINVEEPDNMHERFNELASSIEKELNSMEKPIFEDKEEPILPEIKETTKTIDVYSSVYGPKKEVELTNDTTEIELPRLK